MPRVTVSHVGVLLLLGVVFGAAGAGLIWLGLEERVGFVQDLGLGLAGSGLACLVLGIGRGLWALFRSSRDFGLRRYRRHRALLQPLLVASALLFVMLAGLVGHNWVSWALIARDCQLALDTEDRVEAQWALNQGLAAMEDPLLVIPSDLFDLWGPNRCRAAVERHRLVLGDPLPAGFRPPAAEASTAAGPPGRPQFRKYSLRDQGYDDEQLIAWLAQVEPYNGLTSLDLRSNRLTAGSIEALAGSQVGVVHTLLLGSNPIGDAGAEVLAASPAFATLTILYLPETGLSATALGHLFGPESRLGFLADLDLSGNRLGDEAAGILAGSPRAERLTHLYLDRTGLTDAGALALARSPHLGALEYLSLDGNDLTEAGVARARESGNLPARATVFFGERFE